VKKSFREKGWGAAEGSLPLRGRPFHVRSTTGQPLVLM